MKKIRQFLVRNFALNRNVPIPFTGYYIYLPRMARMMTWPFFTVFLLHIIFYFPKEHWIFLALFIYFIICSLIGFVYFRFFPAKEEELDAEQLEQYEEYKKLTGTK